MRKIIAYTMNYKVSAGIALSLMFIELIVELVQPLIMAKIIDSGIVAADYSVVTLWGSVLIGLSLLAFTAGITNSFFAAHFSQGVGYDLRKDIFAKVQHFTHENFKQFSTPSLVTKMTNDVTQIQSLLFMFVRIALRAPLFIIFALVMSFSISVPLTLILVIAVPLFLAFLFWVLKKGVLLFKLVQHKLDGLNTVIRENLTGIRLIKGFSRENFESNRFINVNRGLMKINKRALWLMEVAMPVVMLGMNACILIILWLGADKLGLGDIQAGELVAIINYATRIMFTFSIFTFLIMVFSRGNASAERIEEVLEVKDPSYSEDKHAIQKDLAGDVRFERVSFFHSQHPALHDVSFHVSPGETVGLLGETGAGKSSLLQHIPRLYEKHSGEIFLDNTPIEELDIKRVRKQISFVPQEVHLFSGSVRENISWGKEEASMEEIVEAAEIAQIHTFIKSLPDGYDTKIGQKGVSFSGGQKQRLSIARALVRKPKILILDDSTSALDANTEVQLLEKLKEQNSTVFLVAQKISSLKEAHIILLLHQGRLIAQGSHEELLEKNPYYREIYQSQREDVR